MAVKRRAYEAGHRPKFLVVIDESPECDRAFYFAIRRAARVGATVLILSVLTPADFSNWFGVGDVMREEAEAQAKATLTRFVDRAEKLAGVQAEQAVREGSKADAVRELIAEDEDIALLVLAASAGSEGPGPLVSLLAGKGIVDFPIPIAIVPGHLSDEDIDALA
jgi:nucleotide-binding universal stress UspA family protein